MRCLLLASIAASAFLVHAEAYAQEVTADAADEEAYSEGNEIIVTATLRSESLQAVPMAVTAITSETLQKAGVTDLRNFEQVAPSFTLNSAGTESGGTTVRIRGVGTTGNNTGLESAVGIFLDGVYLSRPGVALGDLIDVNQIELLRGPQGTLFGRNTSAGAVSIRTKKPNLSRLEGFANATYGNYDLMNLQAGVSAPIVYDKVGFRLSGAWRKRNGFVRTPSGNDSFDRDRYMIRGQLLFEPNSDLSIRLIGDYAKSDEKCCAVIILRESPYVAAGLYSANGLPADGGAPFAGPHTIKSNRTNEEQLRP